MHKNTTLWKSFWQGPDMRTMQKGCASPREQPLLGELRQARLTRHFFSEFCRLSDSQAEKALPSRSRVLQEHHWTDSQDPFFWGRRKDSPSQLTCMVKVYTFSSGTSGKKAGTAMEAVVRLRILSWPRLPRAQGWPSLLQRFHFNTLTLVDHLPGGSRVCPAVNPGKSCVFPSWYRVKNGPMLIESCSSKRYVEILTGSFCKWPLFGNRVLKM